MEINLETYLPQDSFARQLDKSVDYDWLYKELSAYFPDVNDKASAPVRAILLILMEHLHPYALRYAKMPFLASIYDNWQADLFYMWLLQAAPGNIPPFENVFYPVRDSLPPDMLCGILYEILKSGFSQRVAAEYQDDPLYYIFKLPEKEQDAELQRLAREYTDGFYQEVDAYKRWIEHGAEKGPLVLPKKDRG